MNIIPAAISTLLHLVGETRREVFEALTAGGLQPPEQPSELRSIDSALCTLGIHHSLQALHVVDTVSRDLLAIEMDIIRTDLRVA